MYFLTEVKNHDDSVIGYILVWNGSTANWKCHFLATLRRKLRLFNFQAIFIIKFDTDYEIITAVSHCCERKIEQKWSFSWSSVNPISLHVNTENPLTVLISCQKWNLPSKTIISNKVHLMMILWISAFWQWKFVSHIC